MTKRKKFGKIHVSRKGYNPSPAKYPQSRKKTPPPEKKEARNGD